MAKTNLKTELRRIARELIGIHKDELTTAEQNITDILIELDILKIDEKDEVYWTHT